MRCLSSPSIWLFYDLLDLTDDEHPADLIVSNDGLNLSVNDLEVDTGKLSSFAYGTVWVCIALLTYRKPTPKGIVENLVVYKLVGFTIDTILSGVTINRFNAAGFLEYLRGLSISELGWDSCEFLSRLTH